jgi:hypothetical protein
MGCYSCGSEHGDAFKLCPACIEQRKGQRAQIKKAALDSHRSTEPDPVLAVTSSKTLKLLGLGVLVTIVFAILLLQGPIADFGIVSTAFFAGMISCFVVGVFTWMLFWSRMLVFDLFWAIGACIVPPLVYRYVVVRWDEPQVRSLFVVHFLSLVISLALMFGLAMQLQTSPLEVYKLYSFYIDGKKPVFSSASGEASYEDQTESSAVSVEEYYPP